MKIAASFLVFLTGIVHVYASAGPPPFTNGSPLVSGVDGSYQATARGRNLTGVFRFTYANVVQTSSPRLPTGNTVPNLLTDPYNSFATVQLFSRKFKFRGVRNATGTTTSSTTTSN